MESKVDIWMPLSIGDYLADTSHLSTLQHGAYLLMLMHYWRKGPLPNDPATLANITKLPIDAWSINQAVLMQFYFLGDDGLLHQKRSDKERAEAIEKRSKSNKKAIRAANARWGHASSNASVDASDMHEECPLPSPLEKTKTPHTPLRGGLRRAKPQPGYIPSPEKTEREQYEEWASMSAGYKKQHPWKGKVPDG